MFMPEEFIIYFVELNLLRLQPCFLTVDTEDNEMTIRSQEGFIFIELIILILNGLGLQHDRQHRNFNIGDGHMDETDLTVLKMAQKMSWEAWKKEEKGVLWHQNIFRIAPCLSLTEGLLFELRKVEVLNPANEENTADHAIVHLQLKTI